MKKFYALFLAVMLCMVAGVSAQAADWFISGAFQGWSHCQAAYKFTETSTGVFTLDLSQTPKNTISGGFVIVQGTVGNPDWNNKIGTNGSKVKADTPYRYVKGGGDFTMDGSVENAVITIDTNAGTLLVAGQAQENSYSTVYLVGDFGGGWNEDNTSYPLTLEAGSQSKWVGEYTLSAATSYIKMRAGNNVYGTGGDDIAIVLGTPYTASMSGNAFSLAAGTYTFTFDLPYNGETGTLTVTSNGVVIPPTPGDDEFGLVGTLNDWNVENLLPMTKNEDGTFVYTVESLAAGTEFKIGTVGKGWDDTFGAEADGEAIVDVTVGTAMNAWKGSSNNFKIVNDLTDVTITFTYVAAGPCTLLVQGTESGVIIPPTPGDDEFGLVGTLNDWSVENLLPMTKNEDGTFVYTVESLAAGTEFKIGTIGKGWDDTFGAEADGEAIVDVTVGTAMNAWKGSSNNFKIVNDLTDVTITFTYVAAGPSTLLVEGTESGVIIPPTPDEFGLVGTVNEWDIENLLSMTKNEDGTFVYTVESLAAGTEFKIGTVGKGWDDTFGAEADGEAIVDVTVGTAMNAWKGSSNNFKIVNDLTDVTITFTYVAAGPSTLLVEGTESGVIIPPTPDEFGLVGTFNEWNVENLLPMTKNEDGNYVYTVESLAAGTEFKIGTIGKGWDDTFGAESESESATTVDLELGVAANAWKGSSHNFGISKNLTDVTITFTYVAEGPCTVMVEGTEAGEEEEVTLSATYNFELQYKDTPADEWTADGDNRFIDVNGLVMYPYTNVIASPSREGANSVTLVSNVNVGTTGTAARIYQGKDGNIELRVYKNTTTTITVPEGYSISGVEVGGKVAKSTLKLANLIAEEEVWTVRDLTSEELPEGMVSGVVYTPVDSDINHSSISFMPTGTVRMGYVTVKAKQVASGVEETFTVEVEAPVEYYNLQGVRVTNPSAGLYIRRQGNTVTKVIVR